jgi:hypothetical protein
MADYLLPLTSPLDDDALADFIGSIIRGITGLSAGLARPRWQPNPPKQPDNSVNWCAFGITAQTPDADPYQALAIDGSVTTQTRYESLSVLCSWYGPNASSMAGKLRDGLDVAQNREAMRAQGLALQSMSGQTRVPELINDVWFDRVDITINLQRQVSRQYGTLSLLSASGELHGNGTDPAIINSWSVSNG